MGKMFRFSFLLAIIAVCIVVFSSIANAQQQQRNGNRVALIVLPFQVNGGEEAKTAGEQLPGMLSTRLGARGIPVPNPDQIRSIIAQHNINVGDIAAMRRFGQAVGASHIVYGTLNQLGNDISIDARLLRVSGNAEPQPVYIDQQGSTGIASAVDELAGKIYNSVSNRQPLHDVEVRGLNVLDPDIVITRLTVRKGDPVDPAGIDQEVRRIWELGYFSDVQANLEQRPEGLVLVYNIEEKPRIDNIIVEGNSEVESDDILSAMSTRSGSILNDKVLVQDLQKITELYREEGFYLAKISHRIQGDGPSASLVISIDEGNQLYIKEVKIEGVEQLSESAIKDELALKERGLLSWFTGTGVLREEYLDRDTAAISAYYLDNGFLRAAVGAPEVVYEEDGIIITFFVREGPRYHLGEVTFEGDLIEPQDSLSQVTQLDDLARDGGYFNLTVMQDDAKKLMDYYGDYGYAYAEAFGQPRERPGEEEAIVDVVYQIDKKQRMFIGTIDIEGNTRTRDNVILREMRLVDGDLYEAKKLRRSVERLRRLNYFEVADVDIIPTNVEDEIDLKVRVKEKNTGIISAGVGYSTYSKIGFGGTIMERNMFGKGYSLGFTGNFSDRYTRYNLSFVNPRLYDTELSLGLDGYITRDYYDDFDKKTTGGAINLSYPIGEYTRIYGGYRLEEYSLYDVEPDASWLIRRSEGDHLASVVRAGLRRDTVDDPRKPTKGTVIDISAEYGGTFLGGSDNFVKPVIDLHAFHELTNNHVLHGRIKAGAAFKNSDDPVPVFERFWIGGMNSIRGYDYEELSPRDPSSPNDDHIGGDRMAFINLEYIWTFYPDLGLALVPFFDAGFNVDSEQHDNYFKNELIAKSVGLELRWNSPMGDLRFSYGYPLEDVYEKSSGRFDFSMGQTF